MEKSHLIHLRNKLIHKLLWFSLVLGLAVDILNKIPKQTIVAVAVVGILACSLITYLVISKKLVYLTMYITTTVTGLFSFVLISASTGETSFVNILMVYFALTIVSLYDDYKPLILSAAISLFLINFSFFYYRNVMFANTGAKTLTSLNLYFILIAGLIIARSILGQRLIKDINSKQMETEIAKNRVEDMLVKIVSSIGILKDFSKSLNENITTADNISKEITSTFSQLANGVESEGKSINEISRSMDSIEKGIDRLSVVSKDMKGLSESAYNTSRQGEAEVKVLSDQIDSVDRTINDTVSLMNELNSKMGQIGTILDTISNIAGQTNLLALNASIEAARAGDNGKGFAVVANEVLKLATDSREAADQIGKIIKDTIQKTAEATEKINAGQRAVKISEEAKNKTYSMFGIITENEGKVATKADEVESMVTRLKEASTAIMRDVQSIAAVTEESGASFEEAMAAVEEQESRIKDITDNYKKLDKGTEDLISLTNKIN